jgi:hypothetical protein
VSPPITTWADRLGLQDDFTVIADNLNDCVTKKVVGPAPAGRVARI